MTTLEITLPETQHAFIDAVVESGAFENASAFLEELVRDAQERREAEIDALLLEAVNSAKPRTLVTPELWEQKRKSLADRFPKTV